MFYLVIVLFVISSVKTEEVLEQPKNINNNTRIIGGHQTGIASYPWQVAIYYSNEFGCGGSVVNQNFIMTAGHCMAKVVVSTLTIRAGSASRESGGELRKASKVIIHSDYNGNTFDNDIAMIKLNKPLKFGQNIKPIQIATTKYPSSGTATVSGWGVTREEAQNFPVNLRAVNVRFISNKRCQQQYTRRNFKITNNMVCAGADNGGKDACYGDSGGALVNAGIQYGIVSFGQACGEPNFTGVYTSVAEKRPWIAKVLSTY